MEKSLSTIVTGLIAAAWRRRGLLLTPLLVLIPLSLLGAKYLPRSYVSTALMVMQESDRDNPFVEKTGIDYTLSKRIEGLEAWLESEHVLTDILRDFTELDPDADPVGTLEAIKEMREAFKLELVGNDFLRFSLTDSNPNGLGRKLEAITTKFLEGLMVPDANVQSAAQAVLQHRQNNLKEIRAEQERMKQAYRDKSRQMKAESELANKLGAQLADLRGQSLKASRQLDRLRRQQTGGTTGEQSLNGETAASIGSLEAEQQQRQQQIDALQRKLKAESDNADELARMERRWAVLDRREKAARQRLAAASTRLTGVNVANPLSILNAPEGIKVIDPPRDPVKPSSGSMKIIAAGLLSAALLGLGLAVFAELTDQRIFTREEFEEIAGAPVLGRLPRQPAGSSAAGGKASPKPG